MKKRNFFMNLATLAVAAVIGGSFASCSDDIPAPTITDANGNKVQVTSAGGYYFTYDKDGRLTSISDKDEVYLIQEKEFVITSDDGEESFSATFTFDKNDNITKIVSTGIEYGEEKWEGTYGFVYDSDKRLKSSSVTAKYESLDNDDYFYENYTCAKNYVWSNNQMTVNSEESEQGLDKGKNFSSTFKKTAVFKYGNQSNISKQLPYYMGKEMVDMSTFGAIFSVLGFFGFGPEYLPTGESYTYRHNDSQDASFNYILDITQNSNGTIDSERYGPDYGNGNTYTSTFNYTYTTTRAGGDTSTLSFKDLVRNCLRQASLRHREMK